MQDDPLTPTHCECELPGHFQSGVPGIIAAMQAGRLAPGARVERCDQCCRFESDEVAMAKLIELGLADARPVGELKPFTVHCYAVVRVKFSGILAHDPRESVQRALERFSWEADGGSAELAEDFAGFLVDFEGDADYRRTCEFDSQLNEVRQPKARGVSRVR